MFSIGSKVFLLTSSLRGKMGPRTGSIGYFCNSHGSKAIKSDNKYVLDIDAFFVRYGFEKRRRCEHRFITAVIPEFQGLETIHQVKSRILAAIKESKSIRDVEAVVVPVDESSKSCLLERNNEFEAWFLSVINNEAMPKFVREINSPTSRSILSKLIHPIHIDILYHSVHSNDRRKMHLEELLTDLDHRQNFIASFRKMWSIFVSRNLRKKMNNAIAGVSVTDPTRMMIAHLYSPYFDIFTTTLIESGPPSHKKLAEDLIKFKIGVGLLRPVVRSNHRLG